MPTPRRNDVVLVRTDHVYYIRGTYAYCTGTVYTVNGSTVGGRERSLPKNMYGQRGEQRSLPNNKYDQSSDYFLLFEGLANNMWHMLLLLYTTININIEGAIVSLYEKYGAIAMPTVGNRNCAIHSLGNR